MGSTVADRDLGRRVYTALMASREARARRRALRRQAARRTGRVRHYFRVFASERHHEFLAACTCGWLGDVRSCSESARELHVAHRRQMGVGVRRRLELHDVSTETPQEESAA